MIRRARRRSPGAVVAACGCYIQTHTDEAKTLGIDLIGGTGDRMAFLDLLEQEVRDRTPRVAVDDSLRRGASRCCLPGAWPPGPGPC